MYVTGDGTYTRFGVLFDFETEPNPVSYPRRMPAPHWVATG